MMPHHWPNPPCNCRWCNVCAMAGIAYPLKRSEIGGGSGITGPPTVDPPRAERRPAVATLFDQLESEGLA